jgi:xanthine dehydrogenase accessory factor
VKNQAAPVRPVAIVLGCGDIGSAVAMALRDSGYSVVLVDEPDPAWHRRGMAFTDAWYVGNSELDGEAACYCASLKSIPSVLARNLIAATTWSWPGVAGALELIVLVDARGRKRRGSEVMRGRVPLAIGIGQDFVAGENVDVAIDLATESPHGSRREATSLALARRSDFDSLGAADCVVEAARHGRFTTERRIGDCVSVGQIVGGLGNEIITAPAGGVLLGLAARGARIEPGDTLVEVDPAGIAYRCFGVRARPRDVAASVLSALARRRHIGRFGAGSEPVIPDKVSAPIDVAGPRAAIQEGTP